MNGITILRRIASVSLCIALACATGCESKSPAKPANSGDSAAEKLPVAKTDKPAAVENKPTAVEAPKEPDAGATQDKPVKAATNTEHVVPVAGGVAESVQEFVDKLAAEEIKLPDDIDLSGVMILRSHDNQGNLQTARMVRRGVDGTEQLHGFTVSYYHDGARKTVNAFKKNVLHGPMIMWDQAGNVVQRMNWVDGKQRRGS